MADYATYIDKHPNVTAADMTYLTAADFGQLTGIDDAKFQIQTLVEMYEEEFYEEEAEKLWMLSHELGALA